MDPEFKKLLEDNLQVANENREMLKKLILFQKWNQISKVVYWVLIIGLAAGAFYAIEPYFSSLFGGGHSLGGNSDLDTLKSLLN